MCKSHKRDSNYVGPEDFKVLEMIGKGSFGQVYKVKKIGTN